MDFAPLRCWLTRPLFREADDQFGITNEKLRCRRKWVLVISKLGIGNSSFWVCGHSVRGCPDIEIFFYFAFTGLDSLGHGWTGLDDLTVATWDATADEKRPSERGCSFLFQLGARCSQAFFAVRTRLRPFQSRTRRFAPNYGGLRLITPFAVEFFAFVITKEVRTRRKQLFSPQASIPKELLNEPSYPSPRPSPRLGRGRRHGQNTSVAKDRLAIAHIDDFKEPGRTESSTAQIAIRQLLII